MNLFSPLLSRFKPLLIACFFFLVLAFHAPKSLAIIPPEFSGDSDILITQDMHGNDLKGYVFVKDDLRGVDLSEADLRGVVFNQTQLQGTDLRKTDMEDVVAFASLFDGADLRDANLTSALLMQSSFIEAQIEGADFSNAVLDLIQQRALCTKAEGINSVTGVSTAESLGCGY